MATDTREFEAQLRRDGYLDIKHRVFDRGVDTTPHSHPFDTRLLILEGETTIVHGDVAHTYRAGDVLELTAGVEHCELHPDTRFGFVAGLRHKPTAGPSAATERATEKRTGEMPQDERSAG